MHPRDLLNASMWGLTVGGWKVGRGQRPKIMLVQFNESRETSSVALLSREKMYTFVASTLTQTDIVRKPATVVLGSYTAQL